VIPAARARAAVTRTPHQRRAPVESCSSIVALTTSRHRAGTIYTSACADGDQAATGSRSTSLHRPHGSEASAATPRWGPRAHHAMASSLHAFLNARLTCVLSADRVLAAGATTHRCCSMTALPPP
jgi:hypothetical protein